MPGLVGTTGEGGDAVAQAMARLMLHRPWHQIERMPSAGGVACSAVVDSDWPLAGCHRRGQLVVWADGEAYRAGPQGPGCLRGPALAERIAELYAADRRLDGLVALDGQFCAVVHDGTRGEVHLVTDLLGLRWLAFRCVDGRLSWAGEVKGHLAQGPLPLSDRAARCMLAAGQLRGDDTWFESVRLLPAGGHLTWRPGTQPVVRRYACWEEQRIPLPRRARDLESKLADEIVDAVVARSEGDCGFFLSGGLDSRVLLAAHRTAHGPAHTVCFGQRGSVDGALAAQVAGVAGTTHHHVPLAAENWIEGRRAAVWETDGHCEVTHMQVLSAAREGRKHFRIVLDGYLGDALLGGGYLRKGQGQRLDVANELALMNERGRRFINEGRRLSESYLAVDRAPLVARRLLAFGLSLPAEQRATGRVYQRALRGAFPQYFATIAWQSTLVPLGFPGAASALARAAVGLGVRCGAPLRLGFADYPRWLRQEPARAAIVQDVVHNQALEPWMQAPARAALWHEHLSGSDHTSSLMRLLTIAWWASAVDGGP